MRISNYIKGNQLTENSTFDTIQYKSGQILNARVSQITNDGVILEDNKGNLIEAKLSIPFSNHFFEFIDFIISEVSSEKIVIKPLNSEMIDAGEDKFISLLNEYGIKPTNENINLVRLLIDNGIAATKQNVLFIQKIKLSFEKVIDFITHNKVTNLIPPQDIKRTESIPLRDMNIFEVLKVLFEPVENNGSLNPEYLPTATEGTYESQSDISNGLFQQNYEPSFFEELNVHDVSFDKLILLFKNDFKMNLSNITNINNLVLREYSLTDQLLSITDYLIKNMETEELGRHLEKASIKLRNMIMEKKFNPEEMIKELFTRLDQIKRVIEHTKPQEKKILMQIENVKNGLNFINKLNQHQTFVQIPLYMNNGQMNLELCILKEKKNRKPINNQNLTILLSLNTKTLDVVQILIEAKDHSMNCNFNLASEAVKKIFSKFENELKQSIMSIGYHDIHMRFTVSNDKLNIFNVDNRESGHGVNSIDIRV